MPQISMKALLESGVHFGHQTKRWNPKMKPYIFAARIGIYIIDLQKTLKYTKDAVTYVKNIIRKNQVILFVGTKKQAKDAIKEEAMRCGMPYVCSRWLGGTLTNYTTISKRIDRLKQLEDMETRGEFERYPIKEKMNMQKELKKLKENLDGLKDMKGMPGAIFVIDTKREENAIREANRLKVPTIAIVDTNCDPDPIDCLIPGNDDAIRAVRLMCKIIADTIIEEKVAMEKEKELVLKQEAEAAAIAADAAAAESAEEKDKISAQKKDTTDYSQVFVEKPETPAAKPEETK
ncbi:MAG: 30S ribosomal protein S2 [Spirochaetia bacterium]|nr:30S ribosomal protein S2 [Spirochaetia bacterium]